MQITCPSCGAVASLDLLLAHEDARSALAAALQVSPAIATALVRYLALFRPARRQLTMDRVAKLLGELLPDLQAGRVERNGRTYAAPLANWQAAIEQMTAARDKLRLPLKNHGYLYEIVAGMGEKVEAAAERKTEETRRYNPRAGNTAAQPDERAVPASVKDFLRGFGRGKSPAQGENEESGNDASGSE